MTNQQENKWIHNHITSAHSEQLEKDLLYTDLGICLILNLKT